MIPTKPTKQMEFTNRLFDYAEFRKYSDTFIETGCAAADGVQRAVDAGFLSVISIEASEYYYNLASERFKYHMAVAIQLGKSIDILPKYITGNKEPYVFYLDAHVSGPTSFGFEDWNEKGEESEAAQDKTIKAELNIILSNYNKHIICIDDVNGLTDGHAEEYMEQCLLVNPEYKFRFYDEQLDSKGPRYKDKILVAIP